ncbi:MAG: DUF4339 domain-containing protein [Pirellulaceae bacterium]
MGVRFACHECGKHLNIKQELAGRRGVCPNCSTRFRIPLQDALKSAPIKQVDQVVRSQAKSTEQLLGATSSQQNSKANSQAAGNHTTAVAERPTTVSSPELLAGDPHATWYVRPPTGGQYGPANGEVLRQWIGEGRVAATALLWRDGWAQWREASEALPELSKQFPDSQKVATAASQTPATALENVASVNVAPANVTTSTSLAPNNVSAAPTTITSDNFGYEDSDFVGTGSYTSITTEAPRLTGREDVGSQRRNRATKRTASIVLLGIVALLLVAAIVYLITR